MGLLTDNPVPGNQLDCSEVQPSVEERRALIERVARSEQFSRSVRLRDFLLYVGKQSLKEGCPDINELEIGHKVFGRAPSYDRSQDNIVRVNATELRRRIDSYFATDGAHEPLILEIPRGHYKPVFHWRQPEGADQAQSALAKPEPAASLTEPLEGAAHQVHPSLMIHGIWGAACLLLAIGCVYLALQNHGMQKQLHPWAGKPALKAFWGDFFGNNPQTEIVLPDDSVTAITEITRSNVSLNNYIGGRYVQDILAGDFSADRKADVTDIFGHWLITYGSVAAAMKLISANPLATNLHLTASRSFGPEAIKSNNVILLGGKKANPWVYLFDDQINFDLVSEGNVMTVINHHPRGSEQARYVGSSTDKGPVGYSVIAFLPNPSRTRNTIILAGTDSDATNAAAEFIVSEDKLEKLRALFHTDRLPYFEVLVKTSELTGTSFNAEIVAYRTYPGLR